jgi:hypothetical protein
MRQPLAIAMLCSLLAAIPAPADAGSRLNYRGELLDRGAPANGRFDLRFSLLRDDGSAYAAPVTLHAVDIQQGRIAVEVEFGLELEQAPPLKLQTEVAEPGSGFVAMGKPARIDTKSALVGVCWDTEGNSGTNAVTNFVGTIDSQPLVLRSFNEPSLRLAASTSLVNGQPLAVNVVAGSGSNSISAGVTGGTVGGGGTVPHPSNPFTTFTGVTAQPNTVSSDFSTVSGGYGNRAGGSSSSTGRFATTAGGAANVATGFASSLAGGFRNIADGTSSAIPGGSGNCAGGSASLAAGTQAKVRPGNDPDDSTCAPNSGDGNGDEGSFIWADAQSADFISNGPNRFLVRATDGATFQRRIGTENSARSPRGYFNVVKGDSGVTQPASPSDTIMASFENNSDAFISLLAPANVNRGIIFGSTSSPSQGGVIYVGANDTLQFLAGGTTRMTLNGSGTLMLPALGSAGSTTLCRNASNQIASCSSSARYKNQIDDLHLGLDAVAQLRPVSFRWNDDNAADIGFVAEEVAKLDERLVTRNDHGQIEGVKYDRLSAVLAGAVQELAARDSQQQADIDSLRAELAELRGLLQAGSAKAR